MGLKHFIHKYTQGVKQSVSTLPAVIKQAANNPSKILHADPITTGIWNKALDKNSESLVNQLGGPSKRTLNDVGANSYARGGFKVADAVAGAIGGAGAAGGLSNAFGAGAGGVGAGAGGAGGPLSEGAFNAETAWAGGAGGGAAGGAAGGGAAGGVGNFFNQYGQYIGPLISAGGQIAAGHAAAKGDAAALDEWRRQYDTSRNDLAPWRNTGTGALTRLNSLIGIGPNGETVAPDMSGFTTSPDYQFNLGENMKAVQNSAAARGGLYSGNTFKALQERGANVASGEFTNYVNRLLAAAGMGQTATNATVSAGNDSTSAIGQLLRSAGDTRASVISGVGNEFANAFDTAGGRYAAGRRYPNYYGGG
jgi:hypothetical protein